MEMTPKEKVLWELEYTVISLSAEHEYLRRIERKYTVDLENSTDKANIKGLNEVLPGIRTALGELRTKVDEYESRLDYVKNLK